MVVKEKQRFFNNFLLFPARATRSAFLLFFTSPSARHAIFFFIVFFEVLELTAPQGVDQKKLLVVYFRPYGPAGRRPENFWGYILGLTAPQGPRGGNVLLGIF